MKVLVVDTVSPVLLDGLQKLGFEVQEAYQLPYAQVLEEIHNYHGLIIRSRFPVKAELLEKAIQLQFIGRVGAGLENIDLPYAEEKQIHTLNAAEGNRDAVGEHALGMLLMLFNNLKRADAEVRNGVWKREENRGFEIQGKTIGIIGYGQMGSAFAQKLSGFGVQVIAYDKYHNDFSSTYVEGVSLAQLQEQTDILSIHTPQNPETIGMVDEAFIQAFKKDFYLINTARGSAVRTIDLVAALKSGKIKGACLDVLEYEKSSFENMFAQELPDAFSYLIQAENVVLSPHIAGWTHESNHKMAQIIVDKIQALNLT
jgi:D-3-phosphoglycerate dehydrogenase